LGKAGLRVIREDRRQNGLYAAIWHTLWAEGLRDYGSEKGKASLQQYGAKLDRQAETRKARNQKKKARARKKKGGR
jgi:hypothetical protein